TDRLYGGGAENRLRQEILLGIGGVKALAACGIEPEVFHTNEGHAGFLRLERVCGLVEDGLDVRTALEAVRAGTVFTTHTPVAAGIDRFSRHLIEHYFGPEGVPTGMSVEELRELGADRGDGCVFNMAVMGLKLAQRANGVSELHGHVSRDIFSWMWPGFERAEVPIGHITNGVHAGTWIAAPWQELYERTLGPGRPLATDARAATGMAPPWRELSKRTLGPPYAPEPTDWEPIQSLPDEQVWALRT